MKIKQVLTVLILFTLLIQSNITSNATRISSLKKKCGALVTSIPKCGTHLISKLLDDFGYKSQWLRDCSYIGLPAKLQPPQQGKYYVNHVIASKENMNTIKQLNMKVLFIYRDPRDQIVSLAHYMKQHFKIWTASPLPLKAIISQLIVDYSTICRTSIPCSWNDPLLKTIGGVADFYNLYLSWFNYPNIYITTFEKLVGSRGGGSDEIQLQEIINIASHLELGLTQVDLKKIQARLFGNTTTFREGRIGSWRKHFSKQDKDNFKAIAGRLLIDLGYEQDLNW